VRFNELYTELVTLAFRKSYTTKVFGIR